VLVRLTTLEPRKRALLLRALAWVLAARAALLAPTGSFDRKRLVLDSLSNRLPQIDGCAADEAAWAVSAVARRVPRTRCLAWALALRGMLRQAGISAELRIGVAPGTAGALKAHAWLDHDGRALSWGDDLHGYRLLQPREVIS
jgi:hypothetical protein